VIALAAISSSLAVCALGQAPDIRWDFDTPDEVVSLSGVVGAGMADGCLSGLTRWDPYVFLQLPEGGADAAEYRTLIIRLYSSTTADLLDTYYKTAAGYWCLGGTLPIVAGWCIYTVDLPSNNWRETDQPAARKWGGPDGRVISLRIDPGNEASRWIILDRVALSGEAAKTRVEPEERSAGIRVAASAPEEVAAGKPVEVELTLDVPAEAAVRALTAYARLQTATDLVGEAHTTIQAREGRADARFSLPTLPFIDMEADLCVGVLEATPSDAATEPAAARVRIVSPPIDPVGFPRCEVRELGGSPAVFVNGTPTPLFCFCGMDPLTELDRSREPRHVAMAKAGVRVFSDWFGTSVSGSLGRLEDGGHDYAEFDLYFARMLQAAPDALFLPHVYVTPPTWWQTAHPEELCAFDDSSKGLQSFASRRWRQEIGEDLAALVRHLSQQPYADRIVGLIVCSGYTAEWQTWGVWDDKLTDYSDVGIAAWRDWLAKRYGADDALRAAWGRQDLSIEAAVPPSAERRRGASLGMLRDPVADADVIDYLAFLNELDADAILHFARVAKEASGRRVLVGTYYGYLTQHQYHQAESGHCGIAKVLASPDIDFLMSPPTYTERDAGQVSAFMGAIDSVERHGKVWLSEADYRTYLSDPSAGFGRCATEEESVDVLWREFAHVLCKRAGVSWFDMDLGWLSGPRIPGEIAKMAGLADGHEEQRAPSHAEVAVFIDPASFYYVKPDPGLVQYLTLEPVLNLCRAGAPFDLYLLDDIRDESLPQYRMYVFLDAYALDAGTRGAVLRRTRRPGVSALWQWAAGYCRPDERRLATQDEVSELVGMRLRESPEQATLRLSPESGAGRYAERIRAVPEPANPAIPLGPVFVPEEGDVLLRTEPGGLPGLAKATVGDSTAFYSCLPTLPPSILRQVYLDAGVHVYVDTDDCFYADAGWVAIHSGAAGLRTIRLPQPARVRNARTGEGRTGSEITLDMPAHRTEVLRVEE